MSQKRKLSISDVEGSTSPGNGDVFRSQTIEDRASTFVAAFSPTIAFKDLQRHTDFKTASHRMAAWRKASKQQTLGGNAKPIFITGSDDDGEKYGGKRLEKVLNELNVEGAVVCARWYGGVLLGPVRFNHIEDTAREAVLQYKNGAADVAPKKAKLDAGADDEATKTSLIKQLQERDQSILVLRQLLADKSASIKSASDTTEQDSHPPKTPTKHPSYTDLPLPRLQQLDKARDATIAWILKQIDAAESNTTKSDKHVDP